MNRILLFIALSFLSALGTATAQIRTPQPSPTAKFTQEFALTKVDVEYARPSARNRKIFGELVPFGEMWRTGANAATKVTFADDVQVSGVALPKGSYALYTTPGQNEWTIIFYKNTTFWGAPGKDFNEADVAARFTVRPTMLKDMVETFTINLDNLRSNGADFEISWENTLVSFPVTMDSDTRVMADIKNALDGPSANAYYSAARYYYDEKKGMNEALTYVNKSLEKGGDKFWILRLKAQILAEQGKYKEAIEVANRSSQLAKAENNADYPRMNEKSIAEWTMKAGNKK
jgi:hypothetical protein